MAALAAAAAVLLALVLAAQVLVAPYTKVEESFSLQAVHDLLAYGVRPAALAQYDHVRFPGAVPRSFLPPALLAALSAPVLAAARAAGAVRSSADEQTAVRLVLASCAFAALIFFGRRVLRAPLERALFWGVCAAQFHLTFWSTRTTPNGLALPAVTAALAELLTGRHVRIALVALTFAALVLRVELLGIAGLAYLYAWRARRAPLLGAIGVGVAATLGAALTTVAVDTYFWSPVPDEVMPLPRLTEWQLVWPELSATLFNVVQGKSAEWGVSPPWAYVAWELPRLLSFTLPLAVLGAAVALRRGSLQSAQVALVVLPAAHIALLSMLRHKEWRFIAYVVPLLDALGALGAGALVRVALRVRSVAVRALAVLPLLCIALTAALNVLLTYVSLHNYPGGAALAALHARVPLDTPALVHIDTLPAMTGVSLFQSVRRSAPAAWVYDKTERYTGDAPTFWRRFHYLLSEAPNCQVPGGCFRALGPPADGLDRIARKPLGSYLRGLTARPHSLRDAAERLLPVEVHTAPRVWVCERLPSCDPEPAR